MRIGVNALFLVNGKGGGIETYLRGLLSALAAIDRDNEYIIFTNKDCRGSFTLTDNFSEHECKVAATNRPAKILWEQTLFPSIINRAGIDLLFSPANIAPSRHRMPSVATIHDMIPFERPECFSSIELTALKKLFTSTITSSDRIISGSEHAKSALLERFDIEEERVVTVYHGVDPRFRNDSSYKEKGLRLFGEGIKAPYILAIASDKPYKNLDGLLRAYKILKERETVSERLVIAGNPGVLKEGLVSLIDDLGLTGSVSLPGFVSDEELVYLYSGASVFVFPSFFEGFGLPVLESYACGTPVAASNAASIPEAVGDAGLIFDPNDTADIAGKVLTLLRDGKVRDDMIRRGLKRAGVMTWERAAAGTLAVFNDAVSGGRSL